MDKLFKQRVNFNISDRKTPKNEKSPVSAKVLDDTLDPKSPLYNNAVEFNLEDGSMKNALDSLRMRFGVPVSEESSTPEKVKITEKIPTSSEVLTRSEQDRLYQKIEIEGNQGLTKELIRSCELLPKYPTEIDGVKVYLSDAYKSNEEGHIAAIYYVQSGDKIIPRTIYQSDSQGIARLLPSIKKKDRLDKGYGEDSLSVPYPVQKVFANKSLETVNKNISEKHRELIFNGTAKNIWLPNGSNPVYELEVSEIPQGLPGIIKDADRLDDSDKKALQEHKTLVINNKGVIDMTLSPNFDSVVDRFHSRSSIAGEFDCYLINSGDKTLQYLFCADPQGRVWIGNIECIESKVGTVGLREQWIDGGGLTTPLYEYKKQSGSYGDNNDQKEDYISMWPDYLSKIPMIQEFQNKVLKSGK